MTATPEPIVVALQSHRSVVRTLVLAYGCLVIGVLVLVATLVAVDGAGRRTAALVIGVTFALYGVVSLLGVRIGADARDLVFDPEGVRWQSRRGRPWAVAWTEIADATLHVGYHRTRAARGVRTRLELVPTDAQFHARHPEMKRLRSRFGAGESRYSIPFGPRRDLLEPLEAGLLAFAGERYGGLVDDGRIGGFGPSALGARMAGGDPEHPHARGRRARRNRPFGT